MKVISPMIENQAEKNSGGQMENEIIQWFTGIRVCKNYRSFFGGLYTTLKLETGFIED